MPEEFEDRINEKIIKFEEETKMPYVTSWERKARKEGKEDGVTEGKMKTAINLLKEGVDKKIIANATGFPIKKIEKLAAEAR